MKSFILKRVHFKSYTRGKSAITDNKKKTTITDIAVGALNIDLHLELSVFN